MSVSEPQLPSAPAERLRNEIPVLGANAAELAALFAESQRETARDDFPNHELATFCTFIGYPRSGHSVVGSLLDAHAEVIIAHELDVLKFLDAGFAARQVYWLLRQNSQICAAHGRQWGPYSYHVAGQWQGRHKTLKVIGDNKGGRTSAAIANDWTAIERLLTTIPLQHRFLHVLRDPYDNVATLALRQTQDLGQAIDLYFRLCRTNAAIKQHLGDEMVQDVYHEDFVQQPRETLARLCGFLGVAADAEYLTACAAIVYKWPHQSRHALDWPSAALTVMEREMAKYPFLARYNVAFRSAPGAK